MFRQIYNLNKAVSTRRFFSTSAPAVPESIQTWIDSPRRPLMFIEQVHENQLLNLAGALNIDPTSSWWLYNPSSGTHPATIWSTGLSSNMNVDHTGHSELGIDSPPEPFTHRTHVSGFVSFNKPMGIHSYLGRAAGVTAPPKYYSTPSGDFITLSRQKDYVDAQSPTQDRFAIESCDYHYRDASASYEYVLPAPGPNAEPLQQGKDFDFEREPMVLNELSVFRYCATTMNSDRLHYDLTYANSLGYPSVVVPLQMQVSLMLDLAGAIAEGLAGPEPAIVIEDRKAKAAEEKKNSHSHTHSHGGVPCDGDHDDEPPSPWATRFQKLVQIKYQAPRELLVNTPVRILARVIEEQNEIVGNPATVEDAYRKKPCIVKVWVQDANDNTAVYSEAAVIFDDPTRAILPGKAEEVPQE